MTAQPERDVDFNEFVKALLKISPEDAAEARTEARDQTAGIDEGPFEPHADERWD